MRLFVEVALSKPGNMAATASKAAAVMAMLDRDPIVGARGPLTAWCAAAACGQSGAVTDRD
jgi:hypothetical protein